MEVTPEAWETMEAFSDDELETIKAMEASDHEVETIEDISDDEDETIQLPNNGGQSGPGVCDAGGGRE